jgi:hypothetical protein
MWGSSSTDVWAISSSNSEYYISHFDGRTWSLYTVPGLVQPRAIYGFSPDLVFVGAENGKIWKYDGNNWALIANIEYNGSYNFENMWGELPENMYAVGAGTDSLGYFNNSLIGNNVNGEWELINVGPLIGDVVHLYKNKPDNKIYFRLTKICGPSARDSTIIYELNENKYIRIYSSPYTKTSKADISIINNEVYFILGKQICRRANDNFQVVLDISNYDFYGRIWGRNYKDIFILMTDGLAHYNGINIEYLFHFTYPDTNPITQIYGAAIFEKEVFFVAYETSTGLSLVYHGILK